MECDSSKQGRLDDQKIKESYNLPNTCMSFSTKSKKMIIFRWKKSAFRQQMVKRVLTESLSGCPCNQCISLRQWRIQKISKGVAVMVKTEFLRHIRGNVTSFLTFFAEKKMKKKNRQGWRSPDRLLMNPPLIYADISQTE